MQLFSCVWNANQPLFMFRVCVCVCLCVCVGGGGGCLGWKNIISNIPVTIFNIQFEWKWHDPVEIIQTALICIFKKNASYSMIQCLANVHRDVSCRVQFGDSPVKVKGTCYANQSAGGRGFCPKSGCYGKHSNIQYSQFQKSEEAFTSKYLLNGSHSLVRFIRIKNMSNI